MLFLAFPAQLPDTSWKHGGDVCFSFAAVGETADDTFLGLEKLQHLLTDTLQPELYIYWQIDDFLLTFPSAPLHSPSLFSCLPNHALTTHKPYALPYSLKLRFFSYAT